MKQPNRIKAAMRAGRKACGYNLSFPSPWVIDILGKLDFDFVLIDGEHGPFGLDQLEDLCRSAERHNLTPIARVPDIGSSIRRRWRHQPVEILRTMQCSRSLPPRRRI
jgi:2-keto-3-deoxy-L-rhamnonate aldolase RhmA